MPDLSKNLSDSADPAAVQAFAAAITWDAPPEQRNQRANQDDRNQATDQPATWTALPLERHLAQMGPP
jgi:hypothetical protein